MKKLLISLVSCLSISILFSSCDKLDTSFDESLLIGSWVSGTLHYKYASDHTGGTWDTSDNVTEAEAQKFTWSLDKSDLTQIYIMEIGGNVPKYYTVTELTATSLKYHDAFQKSYSFTKE